MKTPDILIVDDDPGMIRVMARALDGLGRLRFATDGEQALAQLAKTAPDLVLLDADLPGLDGFQVCQRIKAHPDLREIPVIFVTGQNAPKDELRGLESGAADFIAKPIRQALLVARVRTQLRMKALTDELRLMAATDGLTGVANRRTFDAALEREWRHALRAGCPLSLLMVDVDHFKAYNDHYGHQDGDDCLRLVAQEMSASLKRPSDLAARYGGEEFAVLLPGTDRTGARHVAHRLMALLRQRALPHAASNTARHVTVSIGIGSYDEVSHVWRSPTGDSRFSSLPCDATDLVRAADAALYAAKRAGRAQAWHVDITGALAPETAEALPPAPFVKQTAEERQA